MVAYVLLGIVCGYVGCSRKFLGVLRIVSFFLLSFCMFVVSVLGVFLLLDPFRYSILVGGLDFLVVTFFFTCFSLVFIVLGILVL